MKFPQISETLISRALFFNMPSSPKFFHSRPTYSKRSSSVLFYSFLLISIAGFLLWAGVLFGARFGFKCRSNSLVKSVRVVWERSRNGDVNGGSLSYGQKRHKVMGFVGIQTGFGSVGRRRSLRKTWMPSDHQGLQKLEEATGLVFRFIIGRTKNESQMKALREEVAEYDDFILLDIDEEYSKLPYKTLAFFKAAYALYDAEFYVKADDDIYLRPDRLSFLLAKDRSYSQTYIGCMKKGPVFTNPKWKWYESRSYLLGKEYFFHAYGPIYALSADVVGSLVALRNNSVRMFSNEDVTIGAWMLAMNVKHENVRTLCSRQCTGTSVAVWDIPKCSGLCNPETKLLELHRMEICSKSPTLPT